jgi:cold shock protein
VLPGKKHLVWDYHWTREGRIFQRGCGVKRPGYGVNLSPAQCGAFLCRLDLLKRLSIVERKRGECVMATGIVKWFNPTKGYGFIQPHGGGRDVFVHISAVERAGLNTLNEGQQIEYEEVSDRGKTSAQNLKVK